MVLIDREKDRHKGNEWRSRRDQIQLCTAKYTSSVEMSSEKFGKREETQQL